LQRADVAQLDVGRFDTWQEQLHLVARGEIRPDDFDRVRPVGVQGQHLERIAQVAVVQLIVADAVQPHRPLGRHQEVQRAADRPPVSKRCAQAASHDSVDAAVRLGNEPARCVRREMEEFDDLGRRERILRHARNATTPA